MTIRRNIFPIICTMLIVLCFVSCGHKNDVTIEGTLAGGAGKTIYFEEMTPDSRVFLDSVTLDKKGYFKYKHEIKYKTFINVHVNENDYIVLVPDFGETIQVEGSYDSLSTTYHLQGGHESQLLWQLQDFSNQGQNTLKEICATDQKNKALLADGDMTQAEFDKEHSQTDSIFLATYQAQQKYVVNFIQENAGSLVTLIALYKPFNNMPLVNPRDSFEVYDIVLEGLENDMPDNPHTINFKNSVEQLRIQYAQQQ